MNFGPSLLGFRTLIATNELSGRYPWQALSGDLTSGHNICDGDTIDAAMAGIGRVRFDLSHGILANWQSVVSGGGPLLSVPDLGLLNPLSLPYWFLPLWLAPAFVILLTFLTALIGTFLFLRRLQLSRAPALLAGFIFATSGFMVMWTNWPQVRVAAFIPMLFWAIERLIQRCRITDAIPLSLVVASMIFGGFPAVTGWSLYLAIPYAVIRVGVVYGRQWWPWCRVAAFGATGLILGIGLTAVQLLPFVYRFRALGVSYRNSLGIAGLNVANLTTLFAPTTFGSCNDGVVGHMMAVSPVEIVSYIGSASLILIIISLALGRAKSAPHLRGGRIFFQWASLVILVLGWGPMWVHRLTSKLPIFADNFVGRIQSDLGFTLAILAAMGLEVLLRGHQNDFELPARSATDRRWTIVILTGTVLVGGFIVLLGFHIAAQFSLRRYFLFALLVPACLIVIAVGVVVSVFVRPKIGRRIAVIVIPVMVVVQGGQFFHSVVPGDAVSSFYPATPVHTYLSQHLGDNRYSSSGWTMYPATSLFYGLRTPTGHAFTTNSWRSLLEAVDPNVMKSPTYSEFSTAMVDVTTAGHQPILDQMGVKYFVASPDVVSGAIAALPSTSGSTIAIGPSAHCTLPGQALRGISVRLAHAPASSSATRGITFTVIAREGTQVRAGGAYLAGPLTSIVSLPLAGEDFVGGQVIDVTIRVRNAAGAVQWYTRAGSALCAPVQPLPDALKLVFSDPGAQVFQRLTALNRIRWSSQSFVVTRAASRVSLLARGIPSNTVLLDSRSKPAQGGQGRVDVSKDIDGNIALTTHATRAGYVVVADAMQQAGWVSRVDGVAVPVLSADDAFVAVYVPSGTHLVSFAYQAPGQQSGRKLSLLTLLALLILGVMGFWLERHRRSTRPSA